MRLQDCGLFVVSDLLLGCGLFALLVSVGFLPQVSFLLYVWAFCLNGGLFASIESFLLLLRAFCFYFDLIDCWFN